MGPARENSARARQTVGLLSSRIAHGVDVAPKKIAIKRQKKSQKLPAHNCTFVSTTERLNTPRYFTVSDFNLRRSWCRQLNFAATKMPAATGA